MYKNPFCRGNFCSTFPDFVKSIQFVYIYAHECWQTTKPQTLQNEEPTVSAIYNMHQNAPTTKSGTCPCTPLQALRLSKKKWLDGPLQNEEPATNLARGFLYKIRDPTPCFLVHVCDFQKHWPLQIGEPGMSKHLSRIATWKKEHHQKYKDPFCRVIVEGRCERTLVSPSHLKTLKCTKIHFVEAIPVPHFQFL